MNQYTKPGLHTRRLNPAAGNPREVAFADQWAEENRWHDRLHSLMTVPCDATDEGAFRGRLTGSSFERMPLGVPTIRDRVLIATFAQWLGSNIGVSFIVTALSQAGYELRKIDR